MYSLLIDTHGKEMNLILYKDHVVEKHISEEHINQSKYIIPKITEVLSNEGIDIKKINEVIVVNGPGSFTGIRIGVTIAKTIAYCLNIPIKSISSIMLKSLGNKKDNNYSIVMPDNKGAFVGEFDSNNKLLKDYFYISNNELETYKQTNYILEEKEIDWSSVFNHDCLNDESCYSIKPLYIKKIEVEK